MVIAGEKFSRDGIAIRLERVRWREKYECGTRVIENHISPTAHGDIAKFNTEFAVRVKVE
jgi:hypothetical protein